MSRNPKNGNFLCDGMTIRIIKRRFTSRPYYEAWGLKCPICHKWFVDGDELRTLMPVNHDVFPATAVHVDCINPLGGLVDTARRIKVLHNEWTTRSGTWESEV